MSDSLRQELQGAESHPAVVLAAKLRSPGRALTLSPLSLLSSPDTLIFIVLNAEMHKYPVQVHLGLFQKLLVILF